MTVYRYNWNGESLQTICQGVDPAVALGLTVAPPFQPTTIDVTMGGGATDKVDLDDVLAALGWTFVVADPKYVPLPVNWSLRQINYMAGWYVGDLDLVPGVSWADQSGRANHLVLSGTAAGAAQNGHATLSFDAVLDRANNPTFTLGRAGKLSMVCAVESTSNATYRMVNVYGNSRHETYSNQGDGKIGGDTGGNLFTGAPVITGAFHTVGCTEDDTGNMILYADGVAVATLASNAAVAATDNFTIGARSDFTIGLIGRVAECAVFADVLSAADMARAASFLGQKYAY